MSGVCEVAAVLVFLVSMVLTLVSLAGILGRTYALHGLVLVTEHLLRTYYKFVNK